MSTTSYLPRCSREREKQIDWHKWAVVSVNKNATSTFASVSRWGQIHSEEIEYEMAEDGCQLELGDDFVVSCCDRFKRQWWMLVKVLQYKANNYLTTTTRCLWWRVVDRTLTFTGQHLCWQCEWKCNAKICSIFCVFSTPLAGVKCQKKLFKWLHESSCTMQVLLFAQLRLSSQIAQSLIVLVWLGSNDMFTFDHYHVYQWYRACDVWYLLKEISLQVGQMTLQA